MLLLIVLLLVPISTLVGSFIRSQGVRQAYVWLLITSTAALALILLSFAKQGPNWDYSAENWFSLGELKTSFSFGINANNWLLLITAMGLLLMYYLTNVARIDAKGDLRRWTMAGMATSVFMVAITAQDLWTLLLTWTLQDILFIGFQYLTAGENNLYRILKSAIIRFLGSGLLIWITGYFSESGLNLVMENLPNNSFFLLALSSSLHSGVFPLNTRDFGDMSSGEAILSNYFQCLIFISSINVLVHSPTILLPIFQSFGITILFSLIILFFAIQFIRKDYQKNNDIASQICVLFSALSLTINQQANSIIYWLVFYFIFSSIKNFHSHHSRSLTVLLVISFLFLSGLPFTFISYGNRGFLAPRIDIVLLPVLITHVFLAIGFISKLKWNNNAYISLDSWYQMIYGIGLFIPSMLLIIGMFRVLGPIANEINYWWLGGFTSIFILIGSIYLTQKVLAVKSKERVIFNNIASLEWFFKLGSIFGTFFQAVVVGISKIFEGDAGMIWTFIIIILLFSIMQG